MSQKLPQKKPAEMHDEIMAYLLGWMTPTDFRAFQENLKSCQARQELLGDYQQVVGLLGEQIPEIEPPPSIKSKLFAKIAANEAGAAMPAMAAGVLPSNALEWVKNKTWRETPWPGVRLHTLFVDKTAKNRGLLLNIAPGAQYPAHRHAGPEHFFLLQGDLHVSDRLAENTETLKAGDFQTSPAGSEHGRLHSPGGCVALVICSTEDAILEELAAE